MGKSVFLSSRFSSHVAVQDPEGSPVVNQYVSRLVQVEGLKSDARKRFVEQCYVERKDRMRLCRTVQLAFRLSDPLGSLSANPTMLQAICSACLEDQRKCPEPTFKDIRIAPIYSRTVEHLLDKWRRSFVFSPAEDPGEVPRKIFEELAARPEIEHHSDRHVPLKVLREIFERYREEFQGPFRGIRGASEFFEEVGLLQIVSSSGDLNQPYEFIHSSYWEYFLALHKSSKFLSASDDEKRQLIDDVSRKGDRFLKFLVSIVSERHWPNLAGSWLPYLHDCLWDGDEEPDGRGPHRFMELLLELEPATLEMISLEDISRRSATNFRSLTFAAGVTGSLRLIYWVRSHAPGVELNQVALAGAVRGQRFDCCRAILSNLTTNFDEVEEFPWSAIFIASYNGFANCLRLLLTDVLCSDSPIPECVKKESIRAATDYKHHQCVSLLLVWCDGMIEGIHQRISDEAWWVALNPSDRVEAASQQLGCWNGLLEALNEQDVEHLWDLNDEGKDTSLRFSRGRNALYYSPVWIAVVLDVPYMILPLYVCGAMVDECQTYQTVRRMLREVATLTSQDRAYWTEMAGCMTVNTVLTPYVLACSLGRVQCMDALEQANVNLQDDVSLTFGPLRATVRSGHLKCVKHILDSHEHVSNDMIEEAVQFDQRNILELLLQRTQESLVYLCDSCFDLCLKHDSADCLEVLQWRDLSLDAEGKVNVVGRESRLTMGSVFVASKYGSKRVTENALRRLNATVSLTTEAGQYPLLFLGALNGRAEFMRYLMDRHSVDVHEQAGQGENLAFVSALSGNVRCLEQLPSDVDLTAQTSYGLQPIHAACLIPSLDCIKFFFSHTYNGMGLTQLKAHRDWFSVPDTVSLPGQLTEHIVHEAHRSKLDMIQVSGESIINNLFKAICSWGDFDVLDVRCCNMPGITNRAFGHMHQLARLRSLDMSMCNSLSISDDAFRHIGQLSLLRTLKMSGCNQSTVTDNAFRHISRLSQLQTLSMSGCSQSTITDAAFQHIGQLSDLQVLAVDMCNQSTITDQAIRYIVDAIPLAPIQTLDLSHCNQPTITDNGFRYISHLSELEKLNMKGCNQHAISNAAFQHIAQLPRLRTLNMWQCNQSSISDGAFRHVGRASQLDNLGIRVCNQPTIKSDAFRYIAKLSHLQTLDMRVCNQTTIKDDAFEHISRIPVLRRLDIAHCNQEEVSNQAFQEIGRLSNLAMLNMEGCNQTTISDRAFEHIRNLSQFHQLQTLDIQWCNQTTITDMAFRHIGQLSQLQRLHIRWCSQSTITDEAFRHIGHMSQLKTLDMRLCRQPTITDCAFAHVARLSQLQTLDMQLCNQTSITDDAFRNIAHLSQLRTLNMRDCNQSTVTDGAFRHIGRLTQLRKLDMRGCSQPTLTSDAFQHVRGLPHLEIQCY
eukprot:gb/GECG01014195.1/.p1 GENE.gb/GECG01014195.1/~~gb/GECG01014195.1/.p1  ORF type:complete len:1402 (+),score=119.67 gb/GECG01014195.1/:1-4206(+)